MDSKLSPRYPAAMLRILVVIFTALTLNVALLAAAAHSVNLDTVQAVQKMPDGPAGEAYPIYAECPSCTVGGDSENNGSNCDWACLALIAITPDFSTKPATQVAAKARALLSASSLNGMSPPLQERPPRLHTV